MSLDAIVTIFGSWAPLELGPGNTPPEWVRLIPPGTFECNDGRGPYHNTAPDQVIVNTRSYLAGREANADYDHATEYVARTGQPAIAAGWIKDWRVADGAVEGRVEWTALGAQRIRDKEYRYVSPVFNADKGSGQVVCVKRFALTNNPAIDALPAIAASQAEKLIASALGLRSLRMRLGGRTTPGLFGRERCAMSRGKP